MDEVEFPCCEHCNVGPFTNCEDKDYGLEAHSVGCDHEGCSGNVPVVGN